MRIGTGACRGSVHAVVFAGLLALVARSAVAVETIRACSDDQAHPPFFFLDREGTVQVLLRMAAARSRVTLKVKPMPARRCLAEVRQGHMDAIAVEAFDPLLTNDYAFPMSDGRVDPAKSVASTSALVFRRRGSQASWDGKRFTNLRTPVLIPTGYAFITYRLKALQVPFDDGARDAEQNLLKLIGSRGELAILPANDGLEILRDEKWRDRLEVLPASFTTQEFYLLFSKRYFQDKPAVAEALWQGIADLKNSPEYHKAIGSASSGR